VHSVDPQDSTALGIVDEFAHWVAIGLAGLANILDPACIVIGGGRVETTGAQTYDHNTVLANSAHTTVLNTTNSAVTFNGTVNNQVARDS